MKFNPNMLVPVCDGKCDLCNAKQITPKFNYGDKVKVIKAKYEHLGGRIFDKTFIVVHTYIPSERCRTNLIKYDLREFYKGKKQCCGMWQFSESILYAAEEL